MGPEPPPVFTPVYGSLSTALGSLIFAVTNTNVDFPMIGPFSGTTPNIADEKGEEMELERVAAITAFINLAIALNVKMIWIRKLINESHPLGVTFSYPLYFY